MTMNTRRVAIAAFAVGLGIATAGALVLDAGPASAWSHTIELDERHSVVLLDQVVAEIQRTCQTSERVALNVRSRVGRFSTSFDCVLFQGDSAAGIRIQLVAAAGKHNRASAKTDRVIALMQVLLPDQAFGRDGMIWFTAAGYGARCQGAQRPMEIREQMAAAAQGTHETPEHWTLVEAVAIAGVCPRQLPALFRTVSRIGHPEAAATVKHRLDAASRRNDAT
jgi:hypothetical protein